MKKTMIRMLTLALCLALLPLGALAEVGALQLTSYLFSEAELISSEIYDEGIYKCYTYADGVMFVEVLSVAFAEDGEYPMVGDLEFENYILRRYQDFGEGLEYVDAVPYTSYPAQRLRFTSGENEDMRVVNAVAIWTDACTFVFIISADADAYYGMIDGYENGEAADAVEEWISSLAISDDEYAQSAEQPENSVYLIADFSCGSAEPVQEYYEVYADEEVAPELLADGLTALTGLDFFITSAYTQSGIVIDWQAGSTLVAGLDDREQTEAFFMYDVESLNWFMMDSLYATLSQNLDVSEVYYTMDGGQTLYLPDMSYPQEFPSDIPYMGSAFYAAHEDAAGE